MRLSHCLQGAIFRPELSEPKYWSPGFHTTSAKVYRLLDDDLMPPCHQRFLVRTPSGRSLLIAHNIDLAPRINNLEEGDSLLIQGEFIDNEQGGLIHWTHAPKGWIIHKGKTYK